MSVVYCVDRRRRVELQGVVPKKRKKCGGEVHSFVAPRKHRPVLSFTPPPPKTSADALVN